MRQKLLKKWYIFLSIILFTFADMNITSVLRKLFIARQRDAAIKGYDDFAKNVPVNTYEELKGDIERMRHGEADV